MTNVVTNTILSVSTTGLQTSVATTPSNDVIQVESNGDVVHVTTATASIRAVQNASQVATLTDLNTIVVGRDGVDVISLRSPVFIYSGGRLTQVTYAGGETKTLSYTGDALTSIAFYDGTATTTKTFNYTPEGVLTHITES
jgi:hypothetical protein